MTRAPAVRLTADELIEDLEFLVDAGVGFREAAKRTGRLVDTLETFLYRHERADLIAGLRSHDPIAIKQPTTEGDRYTAWRRSPAGQAIVRRIETHLEHVRTLWHDDERVIAQRVLDLLDEDVPRRAAA